jgi:hypothetical protein
MVRYTLQQRVFLYDTYVRYGSAGKCRRKFRDERVPSSQTIHNLASKLRTKGLLIDEKQKRNRWGLPEKLDAIGATIERTPRKSLKCLGQKNGVSESSARRATQLLKFRPYKTTVIHALQLHDPPSRVHLCSWFLQSVVETEIDPQLTFFSDEAWFRLQGYINTQRQELPFIPNVIGRQACWFVGNIRMHLAASGAPVVMKRRAVEPVNKAKVLPVYARVCSTNIMLDIAHCRRYISFGRGRYCFLRVIDCHYSGRFLLLSSFLVATFMIEPEILRTLS